MHRPPAVSAIRGIETVRERSKALPQPAGEQWPAKTRNGSQQSPQGGDTDTRVAIPGRPTVATLIPFQSTLSRAVVNEPPRKLAGRQMNEVMMIR